MRMTMKPIQLVLQGINSFIEKQTVDFTKLTANGLFGIFGPTGSGKSTILDGITLALYGEIVRKSTNYINVNCETAYVSFTFKMAQKEGDYTVEREMKRDKTGEGIQSGKCRLIYKKNGEETILATKVREVTNQCKELIGLSLEDFTRTVMLPQGKFSDFLKLEGKPRRDMLERLFGLEEYGDQLSLRLQAKMAREREKQQKKEGELQAYIEVTEEALQECKKEKKSLKKENKLQLEEIESQTKHLLKIEEKIKTQQEIKELLEEKQQLEQQRSYINGLEEKVKCAQKAQIVLPLCTQFEEIEQELEKRQQEREELKSKFTTLEKDYGLLSEELLQVQKEVATQTPILLERRYLYKQGVEQAQKLQEKTTSLNEKIKAQTALETTKEQLAKQEEDLLKQQENKKSEKESIEKSIATIREALKRKGMVEEGASKEAKIKEYETQKNERIKEENACRSQLLTEQEQQKALTKKQEIQSKQIKEHQEEIEQLEDKKEQLKQQLLGLQDNFTQMRLEEMTEMLKAHTHQGDNCPICGTLITVPLTRKGSNKKNDDIETELSKKQQELEKLESKIDESRKQQDKRIEKLHQIESDIAINQTRQENKQEQIRSYESQITELEQQISSLIKACKEEKEEYQMISFGEELEHLKQEEQRREQLEEQRIFKEKEIETLHLSLSKLKEELNETNHDEEIIRKDVEELSSIIKEIEGFFETNHINEKNIKELYETNETNILSLETKQKDITVKEQKLKETLQQTKDIYKERDGSYKQLTRQFIKQEERLKDSLKEQGFETITEVKRTILSEEEFEKVTEEVTKHHNQYQQVIGKLSKYQKLQNESEVDTEQYQQDKKELEEKKKIQKGLEKQITELEVREKEVTQKIQIKQQIQVELEATNHMCSMLKQLDKLLKGKKFVEYVAQTRLEYITKEATAILFQISNGKYKMIVNENAKFLLIDMKNGGALRDVSTLSGGETFLVSLALALALSNEIQLKGNTSLEIFFLDEGFGTLDDELVDTVIDALESLQTSRRAIGIISHVEQIKNRVAARLVVKEARMGEGGSKIVTEKN